VPARTGEVVAPLRHEGRGEAAPRHELLERRLEEGGLPHVVLNAAQDQREAEIVAQAGMPGRITVATNMAGRGVDIALGDGVAARGGLYVILSEKHDAGRIDRQLIGRCGRQGEPGMTEAILSLEDPLLDVLGWRAARAWALAVGRSNKAHTRFLFRHAQRKAERVHSRMRRLLLKGDRKLGTLLAFSGEME